MAFATPEDLGIYLAEPLTGARYDQAAQALDFATAAIQTWTRQKLERIVDDEITLPGSPDWAIELPERPVVSVESVAINDTPVAAGLYYLDGTTLIRDRGNWYGPSYTVTVVYTHGFDPLPDDIRAVTIQLATRMLSNPIGIRQEGIGTYNVMYEAAGGGSDAALLSGLTRYRRRGASLPVHGPQPPVLWPAANL